MPAMTSAIAFPAWVIGLMSGTSADGVDAALLYTDGRDTVQPGASASRPYSDALRADILALMRGTGDRDGVAQAISEVHARLVEALIAESGLPREAIRLIGFHGQTIAHKPDEGYTLQIGNAGWLAARTGIPVIADFRNNDLRHGGQGAPLVPLYHAALARHLPRPLMVVNIGGVANVTWIGEETAHHDDAKNRRVRNILAFDCGPGNALIDDWMGEHTGERCDRDGAAAARGRVHGGMVQEFLKHRFFLANAIRALDRNEFSRDALHGFTLEDGAATLTAMTAAAIAKACLKVPEYPASC